MRRNPCKSELVVGFGCWGCVGECQVPVRVGIGWVGLYEFWSVECGFGGEVLVGWVW